MKIQAIFFLATLVGCCFADEGSLGNLQTPFSNVIGSVKKICRELKTSIECLDNRVKSLAGEEIDGEIKGDIESLKQLSSEKCRREFSPEEGAEMIQCLEANEDYTFECMLESAVASALEFLDKGDYYFKTDENYLQCRLYGLISGCVLKRINEKCGYKAAVLAEEELSDLPHEITKACHIANEQRQKRFDNEMKKK